MQKVKMPIDDEGLKSLLSNFLDDDGPVHIINIDDEVRKDPDALRKMLSDMVDEEQVEETAPENISIVALLEAIHILNRTLSREELDAAIVRIQNKIVSGN